MEIRWECELMRTDSEVISTTCDTHLGRYTGTTRPEFIHNANGSVFAKQKCDKIHAHYHSEFIISKRETKYIYMCSLYRKKTINW